MAYACDVLLAYMRTNKDLDTFREAFALARKLAGLLKRENYPEELKEKLRDIETQIDLRNDQPREHLKLLIKKPTINKLIEPKVVVKTKFDPRHHNHMITDKQLEVRKYKKELKSAIKEIKQDSQFLSRVRLEEQMEK